LSSGYGNSRLPAAGPAALMAYYRLLRSHGLNDSHSGNASCRDGARVWITPTGCCADTATAEDLVLCDPAERAPPGASLDAGLHLAVYRSSPGTTAVLHSHGPYAVTMSRETDEFRPDDFEGRYYFGRVPVIAVADQDYLNESPERVAAALQDSPVAIIRGHGIYARGETLDEAYKWSCSLESSARLAWMARVANIKPGTHP